MALAWASSRQGAIQQFQAAPTTSGSSGASAVPGAPGAIASPSSPSGASQSLLAHPAPLTQTAPNPSVHMASLQNPGLFSAGVPAWFFGRTGPPRGPGFPVGVSPVAGSFGGGGSVGSPAPSNNYSAIFHQLVS